MKNITKYIINEKSYEHWSDEPIDELIADIIDGINPSKMSKEQICQKLSDILSNYDCDTGGLQEWDW